MLEHHAYLCKVPSVNDEVVRNAAGHLNCQEVVFLSFESFGIDDVRSLTEKAYTRPMQGTEQLLVVSFVTITIEAQQALLKLLEEPPRSTVFLFCVPASVYLLPTVLSRFSELNLVHRTTHVPVFKNFLSLSVPERINEISERLARKEKEPEWLPDLKTGLVEYLKENSTRYGAADITTLAFIAEHLLTRGAANKYLLEELAFTLDKAAEKP